MDSKYIKLNLLTIKLDKMINHILTMCNNDKYMYSEAYMLNINIYFNTFDKIINLQKEINKIKL